MSTPLAITRYWDDWEVSVTGNGVVTPSLDNTLSTVSSDNSSRSFLRKRIPASPGEKITVSCLGSVDSGALKISIDYPAEGSSKSSVTMEGNGLARYICEYTIPYEADSALDYVQVSIGVFTSFAGTGKIAAPQIETENSSNGFLRAYVIGLISLSKSGGVTTAAINGNFSRTGIKSVTYDESASKLRVFTAALPGVGVRPIFDTQMTIDELPTVVAKIGQYNQSTGEVDIRFTDSTGFVNINSMLVDGEVAYCWVRASGL